MKDFLNILAEPGQVVEVRILDGGKGPASGYFNDWDKLAAAVKPYDGKANIYITLNPTHSALLARAANRLAAKSKATTDGDILCRRWLLVDLDPKRPSGICANEEEKRKALERTRQVYTFLKQTGWPDPVICDSGNGFYLLYRVDLPNDDASRELLQNCLEVLSLRFDDEAVEIDTSVFNAARIIRLIGTVNCKGDNTAERPHRRSRLLKVPDALEPVPVDKLTQLADLLPRPQTGGRIPRTGGHFDLQEWLRRHGLDVVREKSWRGGKIHVLSVCPFNPDHDRDSSIIEHASGAVSFQCFHSSCQGNDWHRLRDLLEPGWRDRKNDRQGREHRANGKNGGTATISRPVVVRLSDVEPEDVTWLWKPYIPLGKLTILEGDPGIGKTWLALQLAAIVSQGSPFPGPDGVPQGRREPGNVVYLSAEDGLADTLRPRLDKMGADVNRVFALTGWEETDPDTGQKKTGTITVAALDVIEAALWEYSPSLVVVDPLQAYLGANVDMHRANEVRPVLAGLATLAERYKCAVLCIRHLGKAPQGRAIYRGLGSIDFAAAARSVLLVGQHPDDEQRCVVAQLKNSLAAQGAALAFEISDAGFFWLGLSDVTAEALLAAPKSEEEKSAIDEAAEFLREALADGPRRSAEVLKEARQMGISERTLKRAKPLAGVKAKRTGEPGRRGGGGWTWYLDCQGDTLNQNPLRTRVGTLNQNPPALEPQGFAGTDLECHVAPLIEKAQTLEPQGFAAPDLECQRVPLEGNDSECQGGLLNQEAEKEGGDFDADFDDIPF